MESSLAPTTVVGFTDTAEQAEDIVQRLRGAAFPSAAISVLLPTSATADAVEQSGETMAPQGAVAGVGTGGLIGGALGWLTGVGALAIPGLGAFIAAGPIMTALSGAAVGATVGGVAGGLVGLGLPDRVIERYADQLRAGRIFVSVRAATPGGAEIAERIFADAGADDVSSTPEPAA
jgi:hypothetical protein